MNIEKINTKIIFANLEHFIIWKNYQILWVFKKLNKIIIKKFINEIIG